MSAPNQTLFFFSKPDFIVWYGKSDFICLFKTRLYLSAPNQTLLSFPNQTLLSFPNQTLFVCFLCCGFHDELSCCKTQPKKCRWLHYVTGMKNQTLLFWYRARLYLSFPYQTLLVWYEKLDFIGLIWELYLFVWYRKYIYLSFPNQTLLSDMKPDFIFWYGGPGFIVWYETRLHWPDIETIFICLI